MSEVETKQPSVSKYFRSLLETHPEWAEASDNTPILEQYAIDHGMKSAADVEPRIRNLLGAAKQKFKSKGQSKKRAKKTGPRKQRVAAVANNGNGQAQVHADTPLAVPTFQVHNIEAMLRQIAREEANNVVTHRLSAAVKASQ